MAAIYSNFQQGTLSAAINASVTAITSDAFASLPAVAAPDVIHIVIDPGRSAGEPEIVTITAHTAASTSITVTRGAQSSTARSHSLGIGWSHAWTKADADLMPHRVLTTKGDLVVGTGSNNIDRHGVGINGSMLLADSAQTVGMRWVPSSTAASAVPSSPLEGQHWYDSTNNRLNVWTGSAWRIIGGSWPRIQCRHSGTFAVSNTVTHPWDFEETNEKVDITHSTTTNNGQFTIATGMGGIYFVTWSTICDNTVDNTNRITWVDVNVADTSNPTNDSGRRYGQVAIPNIVGTSPATTANANRSLQGSTYLKVSAGDIVRLKCSGPTTSYNWGLASRKDILMFSMIMVQHNP